MLLLFYECFHFWPNATNSFQLPRHLNKQIWFLDICPQKAHKTDQPTIVVVVLKFCSEAKNTTTIRTYKLQNYKFGVVENLVSFWMGIAYRRTDID